MSKEKEKTLDKLLHSVGQNQDGTCPKIEWMGEDLTHCPGIGEWKCKLQEERYGDLLYGGGNENLDYKPCNCLDHTKCVVYNREKR